jgi:NIMA (never in mitosis gene a)-related kinase
MEYAEGGDMQTLIKKYKEKRIKFPENQVWSIILQMAQALEYLHKKKVIHRDIKSLNVLLTKNRQIKIADMGISKINERLGPMYQTKVGTFFSTKTN